ncbi:MAG: hypothetical protein WCS89_04070 [Candidatus Paceibacterota bacterium]|jgi:hypothetical protein
MNSELNVVLEPGIAQKLQFAIRRNNGTYADVEWLSTGENFHLVSLLARGGVTVSEPAKRWREQDGVIYFTLPATDGTTGSQWIDRLKKKGFRLSKWAKDILNSKDFKPTTGVVNEIAVLKGTLFKNNGRITKNIRAMDDKRKFATPNAEIACMIREMFTDEEIKDMGLVWIVAMHEPIKDSNGGPNLLSADRAEDGRWLRTPCLSTIDEWRRERGLAFVVLAS